MINNRRFGHPITICWLLMFQPWCTMRPCGRVSDYTHQSSTRTLWYPEFQPMLPGDFVVFQRHIHCGVTTNPILCGGKMVGLIPMARHGGHLTLTIPWSLMILLYYTLLILLRNIVARNSWRAGKKHHTSSCECGMWMWDVDVVAMSLLAAAGQ